MASEKTAPEDGPAPDPFEAELVAYLDGELDPAAARKVEARLARDSTAPRRAAELKRSYDLLDYLPRPEPSPTFTTRTLDKLPAMKPVGPDASPATSAARSAGPGSGPVRAVGRSSGSVPVALDADVRAGPRPDRLRPFLWTAGLVAAVAAFASLGFFVTSAARSHRTPARDKDLEDTKVEVSPRVIEHLPLYAIADDIAFVGELTRPDLFGDDPAVTYDPTLKAPAGAAEKPVGRHSDALAKAFRALPQSRQAEIVKLDQELFAKEPKQRDRLFRALEAYAVWLERLPESERHAVLAADAPGTRLEVVRKIRSQQWKDALPPSVRTKTELVSQWQEDEAAHRERWAFIRRHAEGFADHKSPWPFDTPDGRKEVVEFARHAFKVPDKIDPKSDDMKKCRLTPEELAEYRRTLAVAERDGAWVWYGLVVYELSKAHPYLPEPAEPKPMITDPSELPEPYASALKRKGGAGMWRVKAAVFGKWPEFPLEAHRELLVLRPNASNAPALGPAKLSEFKEPVQTFANKELLRHLTAAEKEALHKAEGKWPEYPKLFVQYAQKYNLSVPGVTLPGPPKQWDTNYAPSPARPTK